MKTNHAKTNALEDYIKTTKELLALRKEPTYSGKIEDQYMDHLDHLWSHLSEEEIEEIQSITDWDKV